jgi:hypothetical protein
MRPPHHSIFQSNTQDPPRHLVMNFQNGVNPDHLYGDQPYPREDYGDGYQFRDNAEDAQYDATGLIWPFEHDGGTLGLQFDHDWLSDYTTGSTSWLLQRRIPHAGVQVIGDNWTKEDPDPDNVHPATLMFNRDGREETDLTLNFSLTGDHIEDIASQVTGTLYYWTPDENGDQIYHSENYDIASGSVTIPAGTDYAFVDLYAIDDTTPEWTNELNIRLEDDDENGSYIADHGFDDDGIDMDGDGEDQDPDAVVNILDNDLSFDLQQGTLIANFDDDNQDNITDYEETSSSSAEDDLYEMTLNVPRTDKDGASVTLTISPAFFNVYTSSSKGTLLEDVVPGTVPGSGVFTWLDAGEIPFNVFLELKKGSYSENDVTCAIASNDNGDEQNFDQQNTGVNVHIDLASNANGGPSGDVENKKIDWLVGQMVDLTVWIEAPPDWLNDMDYQWTVPGNVLRDYTINNATAYTTPLLQSNNNDQNDDPSTGTAQREVKFFWVSTDAASDDRTVTLHVGNVNGRAYDLKTSFKVYTPTALFGAILSGVTVFARVPDNFPDPNWAGKWIVQLTAPTPRQGIEIPAHVTMPPGFAQPGTWAFVQTTTPEMICEQAGGNTLNFSLNGHQDILDGPFPFDRAYNAAHQLAQQSTFPTGPDTFVYHDSPALDLTGDIHIEINHRFKTYVMFLPPGDSRWVPLKYVQWNWFVDAFVRPDGTWPQNPVTDGPNPTVNNIAPPPPTWSEKVQDGTFI